jgi:hypothetical protein
MDNLTEKQARAYTYGIIAKGGSNTVRMDFRDNLSAAYPEHFTMLHGIGGKDYAYNSSIGLYLCNSAKGTGDKSINVHYNLPVSVIRELFFVAQQKLTAQSAGSGNPKAAAAISEVVQNLLGVYTNLSQVCNDAYTLGALYNCGSTLENVAASLNQETPDTWEYTASKANPYKVAENGTGPCSSVTIRYESSRNGVVQTYPWYIQVSNFMAPITTKGSGTVNFNGSNATDKRSVDVKLSRDEMFRMLDACVRYITVWENTVLINSVGNGLQMRQYLKQNNSNN